MRRGTAARPGEGIPRPIIVPKAAVVLELIGLALFIIARTTGAGWDIVLLCALIAVVLTGSALPAFVVGRVSVTARAPADATVGRPLPIQLSVTGRHAKLRIITFESEWVRIDGPSTGEIVVVPVRRGILTRVRVEVVSAAPLGLARWQRRIRVELPHDVEIAPRREPTPCPLVVGDTHTASDLQQTATGGADLTRGVREYLDGDPIRSVHWPATARTGVVMVREFEGPRRPIVVIIADLRGPDPEGVASHRGGDGRRRTPPGREGAAGDRRGRRPAHRPGAHAAPRGPAARRAATGIPAMGPIPAGATVHHLGGGGHR